MRNKKGEAMREWNGWEGEKQQDKTESEEGQVRNPKETKPSCN